MKRAPWLFTAVALMLCSTVSFSFFSGDDCAASITIFNKLPSEITVDIDGRSKKLNPWGSCTETADDDTQHVVPCYREWHFSWESSLPFFPTFCTDSEEYEEDPFHMDDDDSLKEEECSDYKVHITVREVEGLDRSLSLSDQDHDILVINEFGLWKVKNPYIDHPEHFRDVYKWIEDAELHQP